MQIISHSLENLNLTLTLNETFNQIYYTKMEVLTDNTVVCDEIKISYSKPKNCIHDTICSKTSKTIVVLITCIDKTSVQYAYCVDLQNDNDNKISNNQITTHQTKQIICPIKNQNIFAKVTKK